MSISNGGEPTGQPQQSPPGLPQIGVLVQYTKDFSFENPNAPTSLMQSPDQPQINIQINVTPKQLNATDFEVDLTTEGRAELKSALLFSFELHYAGVFRLQNIPQENIGPVLMIECPRLLFPFAREIIASAISGGGFPPFLIGPIDFAALYQQKAAETQGQPFVA